MGEVIVVRPRSALGRRIACERARGTDRDGVVERVMTVGVIGGMLTQVVDLSQVVSPYLAETEKNLRRVLDRAERTDHVLVYDEADELFGTRAPADTAPCMRLSVADFAAAVRARVTP